MGAIDADTHVIETAQTRREKGIEMIFPGDTDWQHRAGVAWNDCRIS